jgi:hypothetical protein
MSDAERDEAPTTPPPAIRPGGPVSGERRDTSHDVDVSTTDISVTEPSARDPNTLMSLPKPEPSDERAAFGAFRELEDRLDSMDARLKELERRRESLDPGRGTPWWFWLLFLFGLAVTWRLLELLK